VFNLIHQIFTRCPLCARSWTACGGYRHESTIIISFKTSKSNEELTTWSVSGGPGRHANREFSQAARP
jgi:hypothetical protein